MCLGKIGTEEIPAYLGYFQMLALKHHCYNCKKKIWKVYAERRKEKNGRK